VAKSQVLQFQRRPCTEHRTHRGKESGQQDQHRINAIFSKRRRFPIGTIVLRCQLDETVQLFISRPELRRQQREQLAPARAGLKGREFLFDDGKQTPDRGPVLLPREVK
jgi:hypothetical protein